MAVRVLTPPAEPAVRLEEFRAHLWNIYDGHDSDPELSLVLLAAISAAETYCGRGFIERELSLDLSMPGMWQLLPFGDFRGMTGWAYDDAQGNVIEGDLSEIRARRQGGLSSFAEVWVPSRPGMYGARATWRCGMAKTPEALPADIRMGVMQIAAYWYNNRAAAAQIGETGDVKFLPDMGRMLLHPYRLNFIPDAPPRWSRPWDGLWSGGSGGDDPTPSTPVTLWSNAADITTMAAETVTGKSKTWTWAPQTREYPETFDVPADLTLTALEVLNEITNKWEDVSAEFDVSETEHDGVAYLRHTDNRGYRAGERQIRISWR